jgi:hypothetical protein
VGLADQPAPAVAALAVGQREAGQAAPADLVDQAGDRDVVVDQRAALERSETGGGDPDGSAGGAGAAPPVGSIRRLGTQNSDTPFMPAGAPRIRASVMWTMLSVRS